jgi:plastocyanin
VTVRIRLLAGSAAAFLLLSVLACGGGGSTNPPASGGAPSAAPAASSAAACNNISGSETVAIENFAFNPADLTVSVGSTVTWTNGDAATHTVSFDAGPDCGNVSGGASVSATFDEPGIYPYHCNIHSSMKGTITVE